MTTSRLALTTLLALLLGVPPASAAQQAVPHTEGPDVPSLGPPAQIVRPFVDERFSFTETTRTVAIEVPTPPTGGAWDRVILQYDSRPEGDEPWDRLFTVLIEDVEVLRGTTPRTDFSLRRDVTEYAHLLPPGERVRIGTSMGSWIAGAAMLAGVTLEFYEGEIPPRGPVQVPMHAIRGGLGGNGAQITTTALFPDDAPSTATVEIYLSGHGATGEFWYQYGGPPDFSIYVGDTHVATATAMPYVYAFIGCTPMTTCEPIHELAWWTAQKYADQAGVHGGTGEIPPYRATIEAEHLELLQGAQTVRVVETERRVLANQGQNWPISVELLLEGIEDNCLGVANPGQEDADGDGAGDACDGPAATGADGARGAEGADDVVTVTYEGEVACDPETADPGQYRYRDRNAPVAATTIVCDGPTAILGFPAGTLQVKDDGVLTHAASPDPAARITVDGEPAAPHHAEPVEVA